MKRPLFTATFWLDTLERLVRTLAQVALATFTVDALTDGLKARQQVIAVLFAGIYSVLTSVVASGIGEAGTASMLNPAPPDTLNDAPDGPPRDAGDASIVDLVVIAAVALLVVAIVIFASDSLTF